MNPSSEKTQGETCSTPYASRLWLVLGTRHILAHSAILNSGLTLKSMDLEGRNCAYDATVNIGSIFFL